MGRGSSKAGKSGGGFTQFGGTTEDDVHFTSDGEQEAIDFFKNNSNANELIEQMDYDEKNAFEEWTQGYWMDGQQYSPQYLGVTERYWMGIYDKYLDQATLKKGVEVVRSSDAQLVLGKGNKKADLQALQAAEGKTISCPANMSFSAAKTGLTLGYNRNVEYKLKVKGGTTGAGMWVGNKKINGFEAKQREFMTNRDSFFKVGKTTHDKSRDVYTVELEYMGHDKHKFVDFDYGDYDD